MRSDEELNLVLDMKNGGGGVVAGPAKLVDI